MKKRCIKTFKQIYKDKETQEEKESVWKMSVVLDTNGYVYRLVNLDNMSIWQKYSFKKFKDAEEFLCKHPHCVDREV